MSENRQKILIVDDQPLNCRMLEIILEKLDVIMTLAYSGKEAIDVLKKDPSYDLILLDIQMNGIDGFETAKLIKNDEKLNDIPIIFVTAVYNSKKWVHDGFNLGAYDYIVKPFDEEILRDKVKLFLSLQKNKRQIIKQAGELVYANRSLKILNECNSANLYVESEDNVYKSICNVLVEEGGYLLVWISEVKEYKNEIKHEIVSYDSKYNVSEEILNELLQLKGSEFLKQIKRDNNTKNFDNSFKNDLTINYNNRELKVYTLSVPFEISNNYNFHLNLCSENENIFINKEIDILKNVAFNLSLIIEYKRAIEALMRSEEKYRLLVENMNEGVVIIDINEQINYANKRFFEMIGSDVSNLSEMKLDEIFDVNLLKSHFNKLEVNESVFVNSFESQLKKKANGFVYVLVSLQKIKDKDGNDCLLAIISDISAIKAVEERKFEAQKVLEKTGLASSVGVLASGITHEISQPLNVVKIGASGILFWNKMNNLVLPEHINRMVEGIVDASDRMQEIISYMKSFWVSSSKKKYELFDLNFVIRYYCSINNQKIIKNRIKLNIELDDLNCIIYSSKIEIELILNNLLDNAIFALNETNNSERIIHIKTKADEKFVQLIIRDNGPGLPNVKESELFSPFFSTRKETNGTGLGLAIVHMFVKNSGGMISANNNPEGGACFTINFSNAEKVSFI